MHPTTKLCCLTLLAALPMASCETAGNLLFEPKADDPLDGFEGSLSEVGINTEMDWGPKQSLLLSEYKTLLEIRSHLEEENKRLQAENQNLQNQLDGELASLEKERGNRAQSEAETTRLQKALRERDAKILSLSIDKAKLEQDRLRSQIAELDQAMQEMGPMATEAAASPGRRP
ncbi:MAG: hypothetical protein AB8H80_08960 [Planctomycetota bacterium]